MPQVACCFDMLLRHIAGVDGAVRHVECRMLQVACCFDMLPVAVRHVEATCRTLLPHVAGVDGA